MSLHRKLTWLITGASSGLGQCLAIEALKAGHEVIGTSRNIANAEKSCPEFAKGGGKWLSLDPGQASAQETLSKLLEGYSIDVLVNNAGYAFIGGLEDTSEEDVRSQMEVNYYGPLRTLRAVLPGMRAKGSGNIVLISSGAGFIARPARSTYSASKFAIEAAHESLSHEVQPFGIKVLIVEPGAFRTPFSSRILTPLQYESTGGVSEAYRGTAVEQMVHATRTMGNTPEALKGDPEKAARAILTAVCHGHDFLRLPLGEDCISALEMKINDLKKDLTATREIALSSNF
ncbi:short chain oxidoreductase protein [Penicillium taxi]|uniref:short chain oxidoreductase protein n=1 Tax=Penicillium taxi TaxID=168475 RepID=UPI002545B564|nr:short chain oxidoreductase protein [Penicillium taxi]KAJ5887657.1 short chain oxidoreductase protein [Penicillium taxi]